jgi:hypothetical protein
VEGEFVVCAADDSNEVILPGLDGFFSNVPSMIIGRNKLI